MGRKRVCGRPGRSRKRVFHGNQFERCAAVGAVEDLSDSPESSSDEGTSSRLRTVTKLVLHNRRSESSDSSNDEMNDSDLCSGLDLSSDSRDLCSDEDGGDTTSGDAGTSGCRLIILERLQTLLSSTASCRVC